MLWGSVAGTLITWSGAMLGALLAFLISRRFGRPLVERVVPQRHWQASTVWPARKASQPCF